MKLWLLEILACPIDHYYPLKLEIFRWELEETESDDAPDEIKELIARYREGDIFIDADENPLEYSYDEDGALIVRDSLIIKFTPFIDYLNELLDKINEIYDDKEWLVKDSSSWRGEEALNIIINEIKPKFERIHSFLSSNTEENDGLQENEKKIEGLYGEIKKELEFLNYLKYYLEIEEGVIRCSKCNRWFPIIQSIPQMLPDNVRNKESDSLFAKRWNLKPSPSE